MFMDNFEYVYPFHFDWILAQIAKRANTVSNISLLKLLHFVMNLLKCQNFTTFH